MLIFLWQGIYLVRGNPLEGVFLVPDFQPCIIVFRNNNKLIDIIPGKEKNVGGESGSFFLLLLLAQPSPAPIKLGDK